MDGQKDDIITPIDNPVPYDWLMKLKHKLKQKFVLFQPTVEETTSVLFQLKCIQHSSTEQ